MCHIPKNFIASYSYMYMYVTIYIANLEMNVACKCNQGVGLKRVCTLGVACSRGVELVECMMLHLMLKLASTETASWLSQRKEK